MVGWKQITFKKTIYKIALTNNDKFVILIDIMNRINTRDTDNTGNTNIINKENIWISKH